MLLRNWFDVIKNVISNFIKLVGVLLEWFKQSSSYRVAMHVQNFVAWKLVKYRNTKNKKVKASLQFKFLEIVATYFKFLI